MSTIAINLPHLPFWLLRLAAQPAVVPRFVKNPMLFAAWYSTSGEVLAWPEDVRAIQTAEREKKLSFERMSSLLTKMSQVVDTSSRDVEYARRLLEGVAVHEWVAGHAAQFSELVETTLEQWERIHDSFVDSRKGNFIKRVEELSDLLELSKLERELLMFGIACSASDELRAIFTHLDASSRLNPQVFSDLFNVSPRELANVLSAKSPLRLSGLLRPQGNVNRYPVVSQFWIRLLSEATEGVANALTEPMTFRATSGVPARLEEEDVALGASLLKNASEPGVNLLLYGAGSLDKQAVLQQLIHRADKSAFRISELDGSYAEMPAIAYIAQRALHKKDPNSLLVVDKPGAILEAQPSEFLKKLFGLEIDAGQVVPFDEMVLSTNPVPTVWLAAQASSLAQDTVARFVFHAGLQKARREDRRAQLEALVAEMKVSKKTRDEILRLEDVSAVQLQAAVRAAQLAGTASKKEQEAALVQALKRSLKALERSTKSKAKECVTAYSLQYLNCAGRFGPEQVLKALKVRPKGRLCLYGPPGTGKTQFVEHLAQTLGKPLLAKRASDLLSKWVGDSEKNIAEMFEEAADEGAVLFLDEGDSFLIDRSMAQASWEVTKVNELLQHMERFDGIFIVATNLFQGLDAAALRRFTFKLEFRALDPDQRWDMFVNETGLKGKLSTFSKGQRDAWFDDLALMPQLAPGDFATVKQQCVLLDETLSPAEWIEQLKMECAVKAKPQNAGGVYMRH